MQCPEYVLKCNKSVHLPAWVSFLCALGDLLVIWARSGLGALWVIFVKEGKVRNPVSTGSDSQFELRGFVHQIPVLWLISNISDVHSTDFIEFSDHLVEQKSRTLWPIIQSHRTQRGLLPQGSNGYFKISNHEGRGESKHAPRSLLPTGESHCLRQPIRYHSHSRLGTVRRPFDLLFAVLTDCLETQKGEFEWTSADSQQGMRSLKEWLQKNCHTVSSFSDYLESVCVKVDYWPEFLTGSSRRKVMRGSIISTIFSHEKTKQEH